MLLSTQVQTLTVFGFRWINGPFALMIHTASRQSIVFDKKLGKPVPWKPTYQEFVRNTDSYSEFDTDLRQRRIMALGSWKLPLKKEAAENPDRQIMTEMVQQGFFLLAWNSFVIDGTL